MPSKITLHVSLTPELDQFIKRRLASGRYRSTSELVREALRHFEQKCLAERALEARVLSTEGSATDVSVKEGRV